MQDKTERGSFQNIKIKTQRIKNKTHSLCMKGMNRSQLNT